MFLVNSRHPHFTATPFGSKSKFFHLMRAHLLPKLRCHFAEFLNQGSLKRLGILSLPTCVGLRYGHPTTSLEDFLGGMDLATFSPKASHSPLGVNGPADLPTDPPYWLRPAQPLAGWPILPRHPITQTVARWYGNFSPFSITYAFRPRLRDRLTLSGLTFLRKP